MKVKCITPTTHLTVGEIYETIDIIGNIDLSCYNDVLYKIWNDIGEIKWYSSNRFKEVDPQ